MASTNLYEASRQWAERPDDERFDSLDAMFKRTLSYAQAAQSFVKDFSDLRVVYSIPLSTFPCRCQRRRSIA